MADRDHPLRQYMEFDENDPAYLIRILTLRVDAITKEKEELEKKERELDERVSKMEKAFQRGAGVMIALPFIGTAIGFILAYGKILYGGSK